MASVICTLFENHYHYGVAVLTNSLYKQGYRGAVYAGYRGSLPEWAKASIPVDIIGWPGARLLQVADGLRLYFMPLNTDYHLTNYKPDFMLRLMEGPAKDASAIFYLDPDIVVTYQWSFFDEWVSCGIALCEDVNSPLPEFNPRRVAWRKYFGERGFLLRFKNEIYVNGGFAGVSKRDLGFLEKWQNLQENMSPLIGGLNRSSLNGTPLPEALRGAFSPFGKTDQDALNSAVEAWIGPVSYIGKEAMGLKPGECLLPHALGQPKPWKIKPIVQALNGFSPRQVDKDFWQNADGPLSVYPGRHIQRQQFSMKLASLIGRFYARPIN